tara:strand:- start:2055 stop:4541 length:2487 start_codon:yes stop_codon:yes gene_type:complete
LAIEKALSEMPVSIEDLLPPSMDEGLPMDEEGEAVVIETEDGGILIDFDPDAQMMAEVDFGANLAEVMEDADLGALASELVGQYRGDKNSRKDWEESYVKGLDQLGMKIDDRTSPWEGACGVTHPILSEAVVRFQSQAIGEIFPASGPVKTRIVGKMTPEKERQSHRIQNFMNYLTTEVMSEYRPETEKLLFSLPLAGSAFRKVYWDPNMNRPCAMFIPSEDLVVSYGASSLMTCERITHVMKRGANDIRKLQVSGFYRDVDLTNDPNSEGRIQEKYDELTGESPSYDEDARHTILEMHVDIDLKGFEDVDDCCEETGIALPYVVTIDQGSRSILSIRRNWVESDKNRMRRNHFVHYEYVPGLGFYGFGLVHMIGGIAKSATSILRQLVDAGTLNNLPGGLKSRGLRIRGDDTPISPGEFRDVDVPSGSIAENITFLPYKEPSSVLTNLLGNIVEEGRRFASLTDLNISDMNQQAPVGTTLALMERSMKVMTAVQARLHASMKDEFKILEEIVRDHSPHDYPYDLDGDEVMKPEDFDDRVDVIPVSDPNSSTMAQRIMQYQAALQLAGTAPQLYDLPKLHRQMIDVLGIEDADQIVPLEDEVPARDPVTENMNLILGDPVKAFMWQDHEAHIQAHLSAVQEPRLAELLSMAPDAATKQAALSAHVSEHLAFQYRNEIQDQIGVPLPPPDEPLPDDVEVELSKLVAQASERLLQESMANQAQEQAQEQAQDPVIQMQMRELQLKEQDIMSRVQERQARLELDAAKAQSRDSVERQRIETNALKEEDKIEAQVFSDVLKAATDEKKIDSREILEGVKLGIDTVKNNGEES